MLTLWRHVSPATAMRNRHSRRTQRRWFAPADLKSRGPELANSIVSRESETVKELNVRRWLIPFGSAIALIVGNGAISVFAFGVFIKPLEAQFGWSRASLSGATALCGLLSAIVLPFVGLLIDRVGVRRPLMVAIVLFAANVAAVGLSGSLLWFQLLIALTGLTGAAQGPIGYVRSISSCFDRRRGLAIGIAMSGVGLGTALIPVYAQWLIGHFGWRVAYAGLGLAILLLAWPMVFAVIRDPRGAPAMGGGAATAVAGLRLKEVLALPVFWLLAAAVLFVSLTVNGSLVHVVPMLTDRGWSPGRASSVMVAAGLAGMVGRLVAGFLIDRIFAPYVAIVFFLLAIGGVYALSTQQYVVAGVIGVGLAAGAEVDMIGFLVSRYFGLKSFGQIYGLLFSIFTVGAGLGPYLVGVAFTAFHHYDEALFGLGCLLAVAIACFALIGPYRYKPRQTLTSET
jgi:MFS family permease